MIRCMLLSALWLVLLAPMNSIAVGQGEQDTSPKEQVRIGAVASSPRTVIVFQNLKTYLNRQGFKSDFLLYSDYEALLDGLDEGEVDVAWTSPVGSRDVSPTEWEDESGTGDARSRSWFACDNHCRERTLELSHSRTLLESGSSPAVSGMPKVSFCHFIF